MVTMKILQSAKFQIIVNGKKRFSVSRSDFSKIAYSTYTFYVHCSLLSDSKYRVNRMNGSEDNDGKVGRRKKQDFQKFLFLIIVRL